MGKRSLRTYVDAKCKHCIHDPKLKGTWRQQVEACINTECPLHEIRAVSSKTQRERANHDSTMADLLRKRWKDGIIKGRPRKK